MITRRERILRFDVTCSLYVMTGSSPQEFRPSGMNVDYGQKKRSNNSAEFTNLKLVFHRTYHMCACMHVCKRIRGLKGTLNFVLLLLLLIFLGAISEQLIVGLLPFNQQCKCNR